MDLLFYPVILVAILAPAALLVRHHDLLEALASGAAASLAGWAALAFGRFLVLLPSSTARTVGIAALALALAAGTAVVVALTRSHRQRQPGVARRPASWQLVSALAGAALLTIGLEAVVPHFGIANLYYDWWEHFDLARLYHAPANLHRLYQDGYGVTSRTPLYNLLTSLPLTAFGNRYAVFQVATAALAWLWILPTALLARRFLAEESLRLVALLALSPLILFATTYGWPKGLVAFFALSALDRFLALRQAGPAQAGALAVQLGLASGLALMTHQGFIGYVLPLYALLLWDALTKRGRWMTLGTACAIGGLVALPWYAWAVAQYGLDRGVVGYPEPGYATPVLWLLDHVLILLTSALPITAAFHAFGSNPLQQLLVAYLRTAVGLLGAVFLLRLLARSIKRAPAAAPAPRPLIAFALGGIVTTTLLLNGWGNGWASAESIFIPALVTLCIVAAVRAPLGEGTMAIAGIECLLLLAAAIVYMWSPAASGEPNAQLAMAEQIRFLGRDTWWLGALLMVAGLASCFHAVYGWRPRANKKEPRALWREAPSVF